MLADSHQIVGFFVRNKLQLKDGKSYIGNCFVQVVGVKETAAAVAYISGASVHVYAFKSTHWLQIDYDS
jgi:hypothetical protein